MTIDEQNAEYRKKYWKPEWSSLTQEEKLKDPEFVRYLYGLIKLGLDFFKEQKENSTVPKFTILYEPLNNGINQMHPSWELLQT